MIISENQIFGLMRLSKTTLRLRGRYRAGVKYLSTPQYGAAFSLRPLCSLFVLAYSQGPGKPIRPLQRAFEESQHLRSRERPEAIFERMRSLGVDVSPWGV